jgi:hypothetical protein
MLEIACLYVISKEYRIDHVPVPPGQPTELPSVGRVIHAVALQAEVNF